MCFGSKKKQDSPAEEKSSPPVRQAANATSATTTTARPSPLKKSSTDKLASPVSLASPNSFKTAPGELDYSEIVKWDLPGLGFCRGCKNHIEPIFQAWNAARHPSVSNPNSPASSISPPTRAGTLPRPRVFHNSFRELEACAQHCKLCRVLRQAVWQRQPSIKDEIALLDCPDVIIASLVPADTSGAAEEEEEEEGADRGAKLWRFGGKKARWKDAVLKIAVGDSGDYIKTAYLACALTTKVDYPSLRRRTDGVHETIKEWLYDCQESHGDCGELGWSQDNPSRLVEIIDEDTVRLVEDDKTKKMPYIAISYCWGDSNMTEEELASTERAKTVASNVESRKKTFPVSDLTATLQDAVVLAFRSGISYLWTDTVCIIQWDKADWEKEAPRMHEYYGNALFTLCVGSNSKATQAVLRDREAWKYTSTECKLGDSYIVPFDTPLDAARATCPLASRGWTLQEEYLSPRRVYWFSQGMYWSCAETQRAEELSPTLRRPPEAAALLSAPASTAAGAAHRPSAFLLCSWKVQRRQLHAEWLAVVESYARRRLTRATDRFKAVSGVAARYIDRRDRYLAGLWLQTFAQELVWQVAPAADADAGGAADCRDMAPSWSWVSLPYESPLAFVRDLERAPDFAVGELPASSASEVNDRIAEGEEVRSVRVRGLLARFWTDSHTVQPWGDITKIGPDGKETFSFDGCSGDDVRSANVETGEVVVREARRQGVAGQLDYRQDAQRASEGRLDVWCLRVGQGALLLLEPAGGERRYRRVGVCFTEREMGDGEAAVGEVELV